MPNEFVARNGIIALNNSSITGSLNVTSSAVSTIAGNPTFDGDSILTIKNNNPSSFPTQVLALDSVRSDTPVDIKLGSSTPKGIRIYADNQVLTSSPAGAGFQFYRITDTNFPGQVYFDSGAHNNAAVIFRTAITSGTITERARIASNGNFLIGTATDAGFRLDVNGTSRFQNNMNVTGSVTATSATINGAVTLYSVQKNSADQTNPLQIYNAFNSINPRIEFWGGSGARLHYNTSTRVLSPDTASGVDLGTSALNFGNVFSNTITTNTSSFFATVSGSVGIGKTTANARLDVSGSAIITGSLTVTQGITGSLLGTASLATTASNALTASFVQNAISASFASTASFVTTAQTASFVQNAISASFAATASSADNFLVRGTLTALLLKQLPRQQTS